jgi:hypothetical protein
VSTRARGNCAATRRASSLGVLRSWLPLSSRTGTQGEHVALQRGRRVERRERGRGQRGHGRARLRHPLIGRRGRVPRQRRLPADRRRERGGAQLLGAPGPVLGGERGEPQDRGRVARERRSHRGREACSHERPQVTGHERGEQVEARELGAYAASARSDDGPAQREPRHQTLEVADRAGRDPTAAAAAELPQHARRRVQARSIERIEALRRYDRIQHHPVDACGERGRVVERDLGAVRDAEQRDARRAQRRAYGLDVGHRVRRPVEDAAWPQRSGALLARRAELRGGRALQRPADQCSRIAGAALVEDHDVLPAHQPVEQRTHDVVRERARRRLPRAAGEQEQRRRLRRLRPPALDFQLDGPGELPAAVERDRQPGALAAARATEVDLRLRRRRQGGERHYSEQEPSRRHLPILSDRGLPVATPASRGREPAVLRRGLSSY